MHLDPALPALVSVLLGILIIGFILRKFHQPHVVGYLIAGVLLGPYAFGIMDDKDLIGRLGAIGVVLLLFFIGMEVSPKRLVSSWRVAVIGTLLQILTSILCAWILGEWLNWPVNRSILMGFVISLSSTAVVLKILQEWNELDTDVGQDVLGVLLVQDLAIIPMLIVIALLGGDEPDMLTITMQVGGGILMLFFMGWLFVKDVIHLPLSRWLKNDHEMQVFTALMICFGFALITGLLGLSTALGAFAAGMLISSARETQWVHHSLEPFRVVFVALFFVSIGMLVDINFIKAHWYQIGVLVVAVFLTNTFINAVIIRMLGDSWRDSLYAGSLLSQIGEFSFVLAAVGLQAQIINQFGYQLAIAVIAISLLLSPAWINVVKKIIIR
jgi:CPA2 family monovalent cation:H+ antiporter-2